MSIIGSNLLAGASGQGGYTIEESLRFNASQSSYLSRAQGSATSTTTGTWSGWCKRGKLGAQQYIWSSSNYDFLRFDASDTITIAYLNNAGYVSTAAVYRDPSAWYHIVLVFDTTNATAVDRMRLYVNGVQQTLSWGATPQTQNATFQRWNVSGYTGDIGDFQFNHSNLFDGYMAECYWVDGQALDPSSFGEFDSVTGVWKPVGYTGTYGTNGFYLPMKLDNTTEGFNTVTYLGNGSTQKISGVGFSPDLVWIKSRTSNDSHVLQDSVRGENKYLLSNLTDGEYTDTTNGLSAFNTDGFSVRGSHNAWNGSSNNYVAWCWDAGDTTVSNTDGSITSSVRANPAYGFSVVSWTGNGTSSETVGHGLSSQPKFVISKRRDAADDWSCYHTSLGGTKYIDLNTTSPAGTSIVVWNNTDPTSSVITIGSSNRVNSSGGTYIAYCFSEVSGYSKFGSYTGNGSATGPTVTLGFKPALVMLKRTDSIGNWNIYDSTRDTVSPSEKLLYANLSNAEDSWPVGTGVAFTDTGFQILRAEDDHNASGGTYIYMAFKDTREYAFWLDDSGNNNDWQPNGGITTSSTVTDTPTPYLGGGNYCTFNPLNFNIATPTFANGNLQVTPASNSQACVGTTIGMPSGKWYCEITNVTGNNVIIGVTPASASFVNFTAPTNSVAYYGFDGSKYVSGSNSAYGSSYTANDIIGIAVDMDGGSITFYKNNVSQGAISLPSTNVPLMFYVAPGTSSAFTFVANFGQRPFAYTPPTGFLPLHTGNLPDSSIVDGSKYFNALLWTGDGTSSRSITGLEFQPDLVWIKSRSNPNPHDLIDAVRGANKFLRSNATDAEGTFSFLSSFDSDGFTLGTNDNDVNGSGYTYVGWNWKANGAGVSNTDGSITSTVSANPTAGFSIVTWTADGSAGATIGHGLGVAPSMIIVQTRTGTNNRNKPVYHSALGNTKALVLDLTIAADTWSGYWNNTSPSSTVFTVGNDQNTNTNGSTMLAYCFAEVDGYSKFGSYTGNGSADGPFVHLGFRPAFVMIKRTDALDFWMVYDAARSPYNQEILALYPNASNAETTETNNPIDVVSNGFKCRGAGSTSNISNGTYIYMAFAENPFKNSLAR